ncbi:hypothetical protein [Cytobacillus sp.]|nr:hypothetical protein [Cytobacillus sp.]
MKFSNMAGMMGMNIANKMMIQMNKQPQNQPAPSQYDRISHMKLADQ